ncbi:MAG: PIN domain-containing protein [Prochlorotrichaceae cyanobacterium]
MDTNLWVYCFAKDPRDKAEKITDVVNAQLPFLIISTQVLGELYNVLTRKRIFSNIEAQSIVSGLTYRTLVVEIDTSKVLQAMEINIRYKYSYWDSLIIATALQSDCCILYSEDMQHDQLIEGKLRIINPFVTEV